MSIHWEAANETWAIAAMDLSDHAYSTVNAEVSMQSASVIKAFIMAASSINLFTLTERRNLLLIMKTV